MLAHPSVNGQCVRERHSPYLDQMASATHHRPWIERTAFAKDCAFEWSFNTLSRPTTQRTVRMRLLYGPEPWYSMLPLLPGSNHREKPLVSYWPGAPKVCLLFVSMTDNISKQPLFSLINRWYQNPGLDIDQVPSVTLEDTTRTQHQNQPPLHSEGLPGISISNPLNRSHDLRPTPPAPTQTIGSRAVYQEAQAAALHPLLAGVQTQEQLDVLVSRLETIRYDNYLLM
jgi:hypothetical protein